MSSAIWLVSVETGLEMERTKPTKDADTTNSTTPIPNRAVRCRPEE